MKKVIIIFALLLALSFSLISCDNHNGTDTVASPDPADPLALEMVAPNADLHFSEVASIVTACTPTKSVSSVVSYTSATDRTLSGSEIYRAMEKEGETYILFEYSYEQLKPFSIEGDNEAVETVKGSVCKTANEISTDFICKLNPSALPMAADYFSGVHSAYIDGSESDTLTLIANVAEDKIDDFLGTVQESGSVVSVIFVCEANTLLSLTVNISYPNNNKLTITTNYSYDAQTFSVE